MVGFVGDSPGESPTAVIFPNRKHIHVLDPQALPQHVDRLYRAAWALCGSREDAEDLVQETFTKMLARPRIVRGESDLAYLLTGLRNTYFSAHRAAGRRPRESAITEGFDIPDERGSQRPESALASSELMARISELPDDFRLPLIAVDLLGLSYAETARALGVRQATISTRVYRARDKVAAAMAGTIAADPESLVVNGDERA